MRKSQALAAAMAAALASVAPAAAQDGSYGVTIDAFMLDAANIYIISEWGLGLYAFSGDVQHSGVSACVDACAETWPPFATDDEPQVTGYIDATLMGTFVRPDGRVQVTYNGWPLYLYAGDAISGDKKGASMTGFGGIFALVTPAGDLL